MALVRFAEFQSSREWNIQGLRKETDRNIMRQLKRVGRAAEKAKDSAESAEELLLFIRAVKP